jgi:predicted RND superfamily exporter protein
MSSYQTLLALVLGFWTVWFILCLVFKRSWIPVIPIVPLLALGVGLGLNNVQEWAGTAIVGVAHALILFGMIRPLFANRSSKPPTPDSPPQAPRG